MSTFRVGGAVLREYKFPPILTNRECLDSLITCRVCWNGYSSQGVVYIRDRANNTVVMEKCPECGGKREIKSVTKEEKEQIWKQAKDENIKRETIPGVEHL